ncbi:unnamed protein product [Tuber aestivum]|uniref:glycogenin glucosyltransferase n=1 Tax=Tuber aestivum TaxID=59557 RepID=A0A292PKG0_9PEZI|nr:unnamed protein product [Tuber aestivum]
MTDVYCTLLLSDSYLPGAQVLAYSLRDGGTRMKLAVMVTLETCSEETIEELKRLYDFVIPVERICNEATTNLALMNRLDLNATFTKINLWKQTQFRKIVFIDADVVSIRPPDELFELETDFAAAPDIGWPDCFNSGVMLLRPHMGTYYSLLQLAGRGVSFDGADQGLLNSYFKNWHRISFTYNCTPSGHYQYTPAFTHYGANISLAHFIGAEKPWNIGRSSIKESGSTNSNGTPYHQLLGYWWATWDKHFRGSNDSTTGGSTYQGSVGGSGSGFKQAYSGPVGNQASQSGSQQHGTGSSGTQHQSRASGKAPERENTEKLAPQPQTLPFHGVFPDVVDTPQGPVDQAQFFQTGPATYQVSDVQTGTSVPRSSSPPRQQEQQAPPAMPFSTPYYNWDPSRSAPPADSAPEANRFPRQFYPNEWDNPAPAFKTPAPALPQGQKRWFENREKTPEPPQEPPLRQIFPWENKPRTTTRVFADDPPVDEHTEELEDDEEEEDEEEEEEEEKVQEEQEPPITKEEATAWRTFVQENEWDAIPGIQDYVSDLKRRGSHVVQSLEASPRIPGYFVPLVSQERPSLPVTPNPINRRAAQWTAEEQSQFPSARGIPSQEDWDPHAKLDELRRLPPSFISTLSNADAANGSTQSEAQKEDIVPKVQAQAEVPASPPSPVYSDSSAQTESPKLEDRAIQVDDIPDVEDKKSLAGSSSASLKTDSDISLGKRSIESQSPPKSPESKEKEKRRSMNLQKLLPKYWGRTLESRRHATSG